MASSALSRFRNKRRAALEQGEGLAPPEPILNVEVAPVQGEDGGLKRKKKKKAVQGDGSSVGPSLKKRKSSGGPSGPSSERPEGSEGAAERAPKRPETAGGRMESSSLEPSDPADDAVVVQEVRRPDKGKRPVLPESGRGEMRSLCWTDPLDVESEEFARFLYTDGDQTRLLRGDLLLQAEDFLQSSLRVSSFLRHIHKVVVPHSASVYEVNRDLKKALEKKETELGDAESEKGRLEKEIAQLKEDLVAAQNDVVAARNDATRFEKEAADYKEKAVKSEGEATEFKKEAADYKKKLEESDRRYAEQFSFFSQVNAKEKELREERALWMAEREQLENDLLVLGEESFQNAIAQLRILNPDLFTDGVSSDFFVHNGEICIEESEGVFYPVISPEGRALIARRFGHPTQAAQMVPGEEGIPTAGGTTEATNRGEGGPGIVGDA